MVPGQTTWIKLNQNYKKNVMRASLFGFESLQAQISWRPIQTTSSFAAREKRLLTFTIPGLLGFSCYPAKELRVLFAAFLGIILGVLLAIAALKQADPI
jgi:hypothetical protein